MAACRLKAGLAALQQHQRATDRVCRALAQRCPGSTELQHMYHDGTRGFTPVPDALAVSPELLVQQPALPEAAAAPLPCGPCMSNWPGSVRCWRCPGWLAQLHVEPRHVELRHVDSSKSLVHLYHSALHSRAALTVAGQLLQHEL